MKYCVRRAMWRIEHNITHKKTNLCNAQTRAIHIFDVSAGECHPTVHARARPSSSMWQVASHFAPELARAHERSILIIDEQITNVLGS